MLETLSDDLQTLEHNLAPYLRSLESHHVKEMLEQVNIAKKSYGGSSNANAATFGHNFVITGYIYKFENLCWKGGNHFLTRTVADFSDKEIGVLKLMSLLNVWGLVDDNEFENFQLCLVHNSGNSSMRAYTEASKEDNLLGMIVAWHLKQYIASANLAVNEAIATIGRARKQIADPDIKAVFENEMKGTQGWLSHNRI